LQTVSGGVRFGGRQGGHGGAHGIAFNQE
jgi:hypothetical protein